jgi:glycosyltransferase involved in cell wall biosynthesis
VVHTYHGTVFRNYFGYVRTRAFIAIEKALARLTTRLVAITPTQRSELLQLGIGDENKVVEIPLGLELRQFTERLDPREARNRLGVPGTEPIVAIVARLVPVKNISLFLRAVALVREPFVGLIVGDGEERRRLEAESVTLGLERRVRFIGWQRDVAAVYAASDVVALASLNDGSPVSLLEAMAAGRAVVSTAVGGVPDVIVNDVSGLLVPSGDAAELAAAISALLRDRRRRERLGAAARNAVYPRYDVSRLLEDITRLYASLVPGA